VSKKQNPKNSLVSQAYLMWLLGIKSPSLLTDMPMLGSSPNRFYYKYVKKLKGDYDPDSIVSSLNSKFKSGANYPTIQDPVMAFFDMETYKLSMLVPEIRFYKVSNDTLIPFYFPIISDFDPLENSSAEFTGYVGGNTTIENFGVVVEGQDFFTSSRYIKCNLTLRIDSLANIFIEKPGYARLADLFTFSTELAGSQKKAGGKVVGRGQLRKQNEIAVILAYSSADSAGSVFTDAEIEQVEKNFLSLRMYPGDHTINVNQDGSATIDVEFTAFIDSSRLDHASLIESPGDMIEKALTRSSTKTPRRTINMIGPTNASDVASRTKKRQKKVIEIQNEIRKISEILEQRERLFSIDVIPELLQLYSFPNHLKGESQEDESSLPTAGSTPPALPADEPSSSTDAKIEAKNLLQRLEASARTLHFFTFGDMIEAFFLKKEKDFTDAYARAKNEDESVAKQIQEDFENFKKMTVLLADVHISFDDGKIARVNIADLPVSVEIYQQYIFNEVVNMADKKYTIKKFLEDSYKAVLDKVFSSFDDIAPHVVKNTDTTFAAVSYTGAKLKESFSDMEPGEISPDQAPGPLDGGVAAAIPMNTFEIDKANNEREYFIIYPQTNTKIPSSRKAGDRKKDLKNGIFHFDLGKDRGIIKNINFSKFDITYRREGLMVGQIGLYDELKMPYHANVSMFGNMMFFPGSQIYIDPFSVGFGDPRDENSPAANLGLGGYYTVIKVATTYTNEGSLATNLECSFSSPTREGATKLPTSPELATKNPSVNSVNAADAALSEDATEIPEPPPSPTSRALPSPSDSGLYGPESPRMTEMREEQARQRERDLQEFGGSRRPTPAPSRRTSPASSQYAPRGVPPNLRPTSEEAEELESSVSQRRAGTMDSGGDTNGDY